MSRGVLGFLFLIAAVPTHALPLVLNSGAETNAAICTLRLWPRALRAPVLLTSQFAPVLGRWLYDGFHYEGHRYPNPNPDLELEFEFRPDGVSRLHWQRKDERGFCERLAEYRIEDGRLLQRVTWVNPDNDPSCAGDSDMQNGRATAVPFERKGEELWLNIGLSGKDFFYILKSRGEDGAMSGIPSGF